MTKMNKTENNTCILSQKVSTLSGVGLKFSIQLIQNTNASGQKSHPGYLILLVWMTESERQKRLVWLFFP